MEKHLGDSRSILKTWTKVATREASGVKSLRAWHLQASCSATRLEALKVTKPSRFRSAPCSSDQFSKAPLIYVALLAPHTLMPSAQKVGFKMGRTASRSWFWGHSEKTIVVCDTATVRYAQTREYCLVAKLPEVNSLSAGAWNQWVPRHVNVDWGNYSALHERFHCYDHDGRDRLKT